MLETRTNKKGPSIKKVQVFKEQEKIGKKAIREEAVTKMTVPVTSGKIFDADKEARINIISAILAAEFMGLASTPWRLADNTTAEVSLDELKEANAIALQKFGNIVGV